jgi:hypothetical protein
MAWLGVLGLCMSLEESYVVMTRFNYGKEIMVTFGSGKEVMAMGEYR